REDQLAVEENLEGIVAAGPQLYWLRGRGADRRERISDGAHVLPQGLVHIDEPVRIPRRVLAPMERQVFFAEHRPGLSRTGRSRGSARLRRISLIEPDPLMIVERADQLPARDEAELSGQVDVDAELLESLGQDLDLVTIAGPGEGLAKGVAGAGRVAALQALSFLDE